EGGSMMAGQSVGMISEVQPTSVIISELLEQAEDALVRR
ncbi:MAG: 2-nitropropane dioxygenase, partial [Rhodospirillales bacterium]